MEETIEAYKAKLATYNDEELREVFNSIDREKYFAKYQAVVEEIERRREAAGPQKEPLYDPTKYKTLPRRIIAGFVDGIIFLVVAIVLVKPFHALESGRVDVLKAAIVGAITVVYAILMHWKFGATLGKMAAGIRVVDYNSESGIRFKQALIRDVVPLIVVSISLVEIGILQNEQSMLSGMADSINGWWAFAEVITAVFNEKRRAIHDLMAGTVCIKY